MKWITREQPKINRIACPWLIARFIDPEAEIVCVPAPEAIARAAKLRAIPFDVPDVEYTHYGDECAFEACAERPCFAASGAHREGGRYRPVRSRSAGLSHYHTNNHEMPETGRKIYDALYSRARYKQVEKHTWQHKK